MTNLIGTPEGTTHYMLVRLYTKAGGVFAYEYHFFKLENNQWMRYYTDTDNEYPRWSHAAAFYKSFDPVALKLRPI